MSMSGSLLTLNETTLFFHLWSTRNDKDTSGLVTDWVSQVVKNAPTSPKPASIRTVLQSTSSSQSHNEDDAMAGLPEESEEQEVSNNPDSLKGKRRLTSTSILKFEPDVVPPKRLKLAEKEETFTNADSFRESQDGGIWRRKFIPTYLNIIGSRTVKAAWIVEDSDAKAILGKIWDYMYDIGASINYDDTVSFMVMADQHVTKWRSRFGSAALAMVQAFFDDYNYDTQARQEFATTALAHFRFLYLYVTESENDQKPRRNGVFRGTFVVQTFSSHFNDTRGASDVPNLTWALPYNNELCLGEVEHPLIALALSAAAVERALTLWRDGHITCESVAEHEAKTRAGVIITTPSKETEFNQANWGKASTRYLLSIKANFVGDQKRDMKFGKIINGAKEFAELTRSVTRAKSCATKSFTEVSSLQVDVEVQDLVDDIKYLRDDDDFDSDG